MPLQQTSGNVTADAYGGGKAAIPNYIEDVFSTYLYTGNGSTQTINNGIDLAGKGGMVWTKKRSASGNNQLFDTTRGMTYSSAPVIVTNTSNQQNSFTNAIRADASGFSLGTSSDVYSLNNNAATYVSWTFRKQAKFFDIVTWTGTGSAIDVAHNLGSVPGCILIKSLNDSSAQTWYAYHRGTGSAGGVPLGLEIDLTAAALNPASNPPSNITATSFNTGAIYNSGAGTPIASGASFIAYIFAHNAGGFGLTGTDNVISCGTTSGGKVTLGWEPQWILHKASNFSSNWDVIDTMRGMPWGNQAQMLNPNLSSAEALSNDTVNGQPYSPKLYADGFELGTIVGNHIYIAIRRGPMKVPTDGTKVFAPVTATGTGSVVNITTGFPVDFVLDSNRTGTINTEVMDRLRGGSQYSVTQSTAAEGSFSYVAYFDRMTSYGNNNWGASAGSSIIDYCFRRAPGFFDEVCYTGNSATNTLYHNLGVTPELMIVKTRPNSGYDWLVYRPSQGIGTYLFLNSTAAQGSGYTTVNSANASYFDYSGTAGGYNNNAWTYVAYLFASCPGVSKVFSFTGNGTTQTVNCGFTGGARFVLLKASSATGGWYVYDTARGMTTLTDPYLFLNSTAAETATLGSVTTVTGGFAVNEAITTGVNTNAVQYIGIAIA